MFSFFVHVKSHFTRTNIATKITSKIFQISRQMICFNVSSYVGFVIACVLTIIAV